MLCNFTSGHEQTPRPTAAAAQPPRPAETVPLAVTCPPHTERMEQGFCSWNIKIIKRQTHHAQSGRNSSAAPLRFVARAKSW